MKIRKKESNENCCSPSQTSMVHPIKDDVSSYYGGDGLVAKSCLTLATIWSATLQALLFMEFSGQYWKMGCHFLLQEICLTQKLNLDILIITRRETLR